MSYLKNPYFLLILIVSAFLFREIFLASAFPLFTGQDEARHYNSIQWMSEEQNMDCRKVLEAENIQDKENLATYRFSEEIRETSATLGLYVWREENYRKPAYASGNTGFNEPLIRESDWSKKTTICPPDIVPAVDTFSFFHWLGNGIEGHGWSDSDILTRFYLIRILSVLLGIITIIFAYLAVTEAGFSPRAGLLIALIISLQPRLSIYTTNINYDTLLIPSFAFFTWAGLRYLNQGFTLRNLILLLLALGSAIFTKGTGLILMAGLLFLGGWTLLKKHSLLKKVTLSYWIIGAVLLLLAFLVINNTYNLLSLFPQFSFSSLFEYLEKSLPRIPSSSENFWGTLSWNSATFGPLFVKIIWLIEALALFGLILFFSRKEIFSFLPAKSAVLFCLMLVISLQLGVRLHDWHVFQETGSLLLGTPGRYFLPTLVPQLLLVAVGLGALLRKKVYLEHSLIALALLMLAFNLYTVWLIIIPRFYL